MKYLVKHFVFYKDMYSVRIVVERNIVNDITQKNIHYTSIITI